MNDRTHVHSSSQTYHLPQLLDSSCSSSKPTAQIGRRKRSENGDKNDEASETVQKKKQKDNVKIPHKEVERQRRQEMSCLYSTLRSLVPSEYLKGKRSVTDQMAETAKYIKDQQNKIQELIAERDELKHLCRSNNKNRVTVHACGARVEVMIACDNSRDQGLPLSRALSKLVEFGLILVSCSSTEVHETTFHNIQCEDISPEGIDPSLLQHELIDLVHLHQKLFSFFSSLFGSELFLPNSAALNPYTNYAS